MVQSQPLAALNGIDTQDYTLHIRVDHGYRLSLDIWQDLRKGGLQRYSFQILYTAFITTWPLLSYITDEIL